MQPKAKFVDSLINPKAFHRPLPKPKRHLLQQTSVVATLVVLALVAVAVPRVRSFANRLELLDLFANGRYLVLFQNDAELRPSGGFIGSFAIIEAQNKTIRPRYFETNIYKLDDPFSELTKMQPPKPLRAAIPGKGWALRDSNFAADFRESGPTVMWFWQEEARKVTGPKRAEIDAALAGDYRVDGVIATTLSAFLDILEATGPIEVAKHNVIVTSANFFPIVQQVVEREYFANPQNKATNEPKTILADLFPLALARLQQLPKKQQYELAQKLLREKKILIYSTDPVKEQLLVSQGLAGALDLAKDKQPKRAADYLAVIRSSHGGNKSSLDINPVYRYSVTSQGNGLKAKLEITLEHTGTGQWPSGVSHEYIRVLAPTGAELVGATRNGQAATGDIDVGQESSKQAFGFWLHTEARSSQTMTLEYDLPIQDKKYQLVLWRQPGGNNPDVTTIYEGKILYQGRLTEDRVIE